MKTKFAYVSLLALSLISTSALAGLIESGVPAEGKQIANVQILKSASLRSNDQSLSLVGAALRRKEKLGWHNVYVGQLLVSDVAALDRAADKALDSLKSQNAVAMQLSFLRNVGSDDMEQSFSDGFASNGLKDSPIVAEILEFMKTSGSAEAGKPLTFVGTVGAEGKETILIENSKGEVSKPIVGEGAIRTLFSLWLGTLPVKDKGLVKFKQDVLSYQP